MPRGEVWSGVYYNPVYGYLNMVESGGSLVGKWRRTDSSHWGEMSGTVDGNAAALHVERAPLRLARPKR